MPKPPKNHRRAARPSSSEGFPSWFPWTTLAGAGLIALITLWVYLPALQGQFVWDDNGLIVSNSLVNASDGLYRMWLTTEPIDYWPLTNTTFWIEWRLWGRNPTGYHVTNLILHIAAALLIWRILKKLAVPGAWLAALLFAVHPVNVESVAWIAQRKNTLAMLFFLLSILWYLKAETPARPGWYWLSLLAFTLAMLSKGSVAVLPLLLLLMAWWRREKITKQDLVRTAPFFLIAVALTLVNIWFQGRGGEEPIRAAGFVERLLGAGAVVWFYLYKALVPLNLLFVYPQWKIDAADWRWWLPLTAALVVTAVLLWQRRRRIGRPLLFAWLFFCIALAPVMGFTDIYFMKYSLVADHYQYIALMAVTALAAAAWSLIFQNLREGRRAVALAAASLVSGALALLAHHQSALYAHPITLYEATLADNPDSWLMHNNLGRLRADQAKLDKAIEHFEESVRLHPSYLAHLNLANALRESGRYDEAISHYEQALQQKPALSGIHFEFAEALNKSGRLNEAVEHYREAVRLQPDQQAYAKLIATYVALNRPADAIAAAQQALELAQSSNQTALAKQIQQWIASYRDRISSDPYPPASVSPAP